MIIIINIIIIIIIILHPSNRNDGTYDKISPTFGSCGLRLNPLLNPVITCKALELWMNVK